MTETCQMDVAKLIPTLLEGKMILNIWHQLMAKPPQTCLTANNKKISNNNNNRQQRGAAAAGFINHNIIVEALNQRGLTKGGTMGKRTKCAISLICGARATFTLHQHRPLVSLTLHITSSSGPSSGSYRG